MQSGADGETIARFSSRAGRALYSLGSSGDARRAEIASRSPRSAVHKEPPPSVCAFRATLDALRARSRLSPEESSAAAAVAISCRDVYIRRRPNTHRRGTILAAWWDRGRRRPVPVGLSRRAVRGDSFLPRERERKRRKRARAARALFFFSFYFHYKCLIADENRA